MKKPEKIPSFSAEDFNWCIENDFQVYLEPMPLRRYKIAVRRKGITTEGKDVKLVNDLEIRSTVTLTKMDFKTALDASRYMPVIYKYLRETYD